MPRPSRREAWRGHSPPEDSCLSTSLACPVYRSPEGARLSEPPSEPCRSSVRRVSAACDDDPSPTRTALPPTRTSKVSSGCIHAPRPPRDRECPHGPCPVLRAHACVVLGASHADAKAREIKIDLASATVTLLAARARSRPGAQADAPHARWRRRRRYRRRQRRVRELDGEGIAVVVDVAL